MIPWIRQFLRMSRLATQAMCLVQIASYRANVHRLTQTAAHGGLEQRWRKGASGNRFFELQRVNNPCWSIWTFSPNKASGQNVLYQCRKTGWEGQKALVCALVSVQQMGMQPSNLLKA